MILWQFAAEVVEGVANRLFRIGDLCLFEIVKIGHDNSHELFRTGTRFTLVLHADDRKLGDERAFQIMNFEVLGVNVFARRQHDHVLAAADDVEMAVIELAEVAGAKPAVIRKRVCRRLFVAVVAGKNHRPFYQHFADALGVRFGDLDLGTVHRFADRSDAVVVLVCGGRRTASFGQAVALQNGKSELMKVLCHFFVKTRSS